ncbi:MAG: DUF4388 domain-containing protein [Thermoanaerobaculia bacterium]
MIPTHEQLLEIARLQEGDLSQVPFSSLLHALYTSQRTVLFNLERGELYKKIVVEKGEPVDCRSNLLHERLGRFMVSKGMLSESDYIVHLEASNSRGVRLGEVLIEQNVVTATELFKVLQENLAKKLLDGFSWDEGTFKILDEPPEVESPLKVNVPQLILTGVTRFAPQAEVDRAMSSLVGRRLGLHHQPRISPDALRLSRHQRNIIERIDERGRLDLDELAAIIDLPMDDFTRSLYALSILGIVAPENRLRKITMVGSPAHEKGSEDARQEGVSDEREEHQPEREELMQAYLDHRRMNPFQLLGIPQKASPAVIQREYLNFARKYAPWSLEGTELESLTLRARELFLAGAVACAQLADGRERELLKRKLKTERVKQESRFTESGTFDKSTLLDPEVEYQKARILMEDGNYEEAIKYLESAAEYDPQSGLYRAALAFCWYHIDPETTARQAIADLKRATRIDPGCGVAFLYLGEIHRKLENWEDSENALRKASKLMPTDRRPIDSLKVVSASRREQQEKEAKQTGSLRHKITSWRERREHKEEEAAKQSTLRKRMSSWSEPND